MTWLILEGLDRTGKSSIAELLKSRGFEVVHFKAPDKKFFKPGYTGPSYLEEISDTLISLSGKDVVFDRSWYGELVWPYIYQRQPQIDEDGFEMLREMEDQNQARRIITHDPDEPGHWQRCQANKEPMDFSQFKSARSMFVDLAKSREFEVHSMVEVLDELGQGEIEGAESIPDNRIQVADDNARDAGMEPNKNPKKTGSQSDQLNLTPEQLTPEQLTPEQLTLLQANAINEVLGGRVIKKKGEFFDSLENKVRLFLNQELATLLGLSKKVEEPKSQTNQLSMEEVSFIRTLIKNAHIKRVQK
jgi:hypothetical protein